MDAREMSRSVTSTGLNGVYLLQIETKRSAESKTTTKVPVPFVVVWASGIEKVPAGRVLDGDFAVWWLALQVITHPAGSW